MVQFTHNSIISFPIQELRAVSDSRFIVISTEKGKFCLTIWIMQKLTTCAGKNFWNNNFPDRGIGCPEIRFAGRKKYGSNDSVRIENVFSSPYVNHLTFVLKYFYQYDISVLSLFGVLKEDFLAVQCSCFLLLLMNVLSGNGDESETTRIWHFFISTCVLFLSDQYIQAHYNELCQTNWHYVN